MDTYKKIEELCLAKGITVSDVAKGADVRRSVFTELKMGRTKELSIPTIEKIADFLGVPPAYFLEDAPDDSADETKLKRMQIYRLTEKASEEDLDALLTIIQNLTTRQDDENAGK